MKRLIDTHTHTHTTFPMPPKKQVTPALRKWTAAIKEAGVKGVPRKGTDDYKRVKEIYERK